MFTFINCAFSKSCFDDTSHLHDENNKETGFSYKLNNDMLQLICSSPQFFGVKYGEEYVGYSLVFIAEHMHYGKVIGLQDVIFISKKYRKGRVGIDFIKYIEKVCKELGCEGIIQTSSAKRDIGPIFERLGYNKLEVSYFKEI